MISVLTAWRIKKWFKNQRSEFGRLKNLVRGKKSGTAPTGWTVMNKWRWSAWAFLWDSIVLRHHADDTNVGIYILIYFVWELSIPFVNISILFSITFVVPFQCSNYVLSYVQVSDSEHSRDDADQSGSTPKKSPRRSPKKSRGVKDKGEGKKTDWEASMALMAKSQAESVKTTRQVRILIDMVKIMFIDKINKVYKNVTHTICMCNSCWTQEEKKRMLT